LPTIGGRIRCDISPELMERPIDEWPGFFMTSFAGKFDGKKRVAAKLVCFQKIKNGPFVPRGVAFYEGALFYTQRKDPYRCPVRFFVGVLPDRTIVPLRLPIVRQQVIVSRHGRYSGTICHRDVDFPPAFVDINNDYNETYGETRSVEEFARVV